MHKAILSERERKLSQFLQDGKKIEDRMLKLRIKRNFPRLSDDFELIRKAKDSLQLRCKETH